MSALGLFVAGGGMWLDWKEPEAIFEFTETKPTQLVEAYIPTLERDKWTLGLIAAGIISPPHS